MVALHQHIKRCGATLEDFVDKLVVVFFHALRFPLKVTQEWTWTGFKQFPILGIARVNFLDGEPH